MAVSYTDESGDTWLVEEGARIGAGFIRLGEDPPAASSIVLTFYRTHILTRFRCMPQTAIRCGERAQWLQGTTNITCSGCDSHLVPCSSRRIEAYVSTTQNYRSRDDTLRVRHCVAWRSTAESRGIASNVGLLPRP